MKRVALIVVSLLAVTIVAGAVYVYFGSADLIRLVRAQEVLLEDAIATLDLPGADLLAGPSEDLDASTIRWGWALTHTGPLGEVVDGVGSEVFQRRWWKEGDHVEKSALFEVDESSLGGCRAAVGALDVGSGCGTGETTDLLANVRFDRGVESGIFFTRFPPGSRGDALLRSEVGGRYRRFVEARRAGGRAVTVALVLLSCDSPATPTCEGQPGRGPVPTPTRDESAGR